MTPAALAEAMGRWATIADCAATELARAGDDGQVAIVRADAATLRAGAAAMREAQKMSVPCAVRVTDASYLVTLPQEGAR